MPVNFQLQIKDEVSPLLRKIGPALNSPDIKRVMGRAIVPVVKGNFEKLNAQSNNPLGHSGYWLKAADSVHQPSVESDGFSIGIGKIGVALHLFGGEVRPGKSISRHSGKPTQFLTIPARSEAYNKRADEFPNLKLQYGRNGQPVALVERDDQPSSESQVVTSRNGVKRRVKFQKAPEKSGGIVMFWLLKSVTIKPNPDVIPATKEMTEPAFTDAVKYLDRITARSSTGGAE